MFTKSFKSKIIFRVLLLAATVLLLAFLVFKMNFIFVTITVALLAVAQIFSLIHFAEKTNRDLSRFLLSIRYDDTSQAFTSEGLGTSFSELKQAFSEVMRKLRETRSESEVHSRYLKTILQHIGTGIIVFKQDGTINLINNAAKKILKINLLNNIKGLQSKYPKLVDTLISLKQNEKKHVNLQMDNETGFLSIYSHPFILNEEKNILVSIQNIQEELEAKEMEAWQNLIRVLTHEIMNSITPISSMSSSILDILFVNEKAVSGKDITPEDMDDIIGALQTINQRSQGLMNFVGNYRNMTLIPDPNFRIISITEFFQNLERLMSDKIYNNGITFNWSVEPESLEFTADPGLMEQVMINLLLNAIYAVTGKKDPRIIMKAYLGQDGAVIITVEDNGVGIVEEALDKIFIPFYTTKEKGSGIGLSLSRRIVRMHKGSIKVKSIVDEGSIFTLRFV